VDANNPDLELKYKENNITLYKVHFKNRNIKLIDYFSNIKELFKLSKIIRTEKVDILYGHDFFSAFIIRLCYLLCFLQFYHVKKVYISIHNLLFWLKKQHNLINRFLSIFTNKIVCVSNSVMEYSLKYDKIKKSKYEVIYNGIDVNEFVFSDDYRNSIRTEYNFEKDLLIIGTIGTISFRKGHHILIKAFKKFRLSHPNSLLVIFGGFRNIDGEDNIKNEIDKLINGLGLCDYVKILKPRLDIHKAYSMFDIFVMPSIVEGFGLSLVEAMSCSSLTIASDIPPFKEILAHKKTGILFKSEDEDDLLRVLNEMYNLNDIDKNKLKNNARLSVIQNLSSEKMGKQFAELYENL